MLTADSPAPNRSEFQQILYYTRHGSSVETSLSLTKLDSFLRLLFPGSWWTSPSGTWTRSPCVRSRTAAPSTWRRCVWSWRSWRPSGRPSSGSARPTRTAAASAAMTRRTTRSFSASPPRTVGLCVSVSEHDDSSWVLNETPTKRPKCYSLNRLSISIPAIFISSFVKSCLCVYVRSALRLRLLILWFQPAPSQSKSVFLKTRLWSFNSRHILPIEGMIVFLFSCFLTEVVLPPSPKLPLMNVLIFYLIPYISPHSTSSVWSLRLLMHLNHWCWYSSSAETFRSLDHSQNGRARHKNVLRRKSYSVWSDFRSSQNHPGK